MMVPELWFSRVVGSQQVDALLSHHLPRFLYNIRSGIDNLSAHIDLDPFQSAHFSQSGNPEFAATKRRRFDNFASVQWYFTQTLFNICSS